MPLTSPASLDKKNPKTNASRVVGFVQISIHADPVVSTESQKRELSAQQLWTEDIADEFADNVDYNLEAPMLELEVPETNFFCISNQHRSHRPMKKTQVLILMRKWSFCINTSLNVFNSMLVRSALIPVSLTSK